MKFFFSGTWLCEFSHSSHYGIYNLNREPIFSRRNIRGPDWGPDGILEGDPDSRGGPEWGPDGGSRWVQRGSRRGQKGGPDGGLYALYSPYFFYPIRGKFDVRDSFRNWAFDTILES